jgi:hypothetical protein
VPNDNADVRLAEYQSLRQEIDERRKLESTIFLFQLTSVGVIFAYVLSNPTTSLLLLILPVSSYILFTRYALYSLGTAEIRTYIRTELSPKLGKALEWEAWIKERTPLLKGYFFVHPTALAFPAPSLVAIVWTITETLTGPARSPFVIAGAVAAIILDLVLIIRQWQLIKRGRQLGLISWIIPRIL